MKTLSVCQIKEMHTKIVTTVCGRQTTTAHATIWWRQVTCQDCINHRVPPDEYAESLEALLR